MQMKSTATSCQHTTTYQGRLPICSPLLNKMIKSDRHVHKKGENSLYSKNHAGPRPYYTKTTSSPMVYTERT